MINAEVQKSGSENVLSTIRKFTRKVQGTGLVKTVRGNRYHSRNTSKAVNKKGALKRLKRRADYNQQVKEGKIVEKAKRTPFQTRETQPTTNTQSRFGENTPIAR